MGIWLKVGVVLIGAVAVILNVYWFFDSREHRFLTQALKDSENVDGFAFFSYEGVFDNVEIWFNDNGYVLFSYLDFNPALNGKAGGTLQQIGVVEIECISKLSGKLRGVPLIHLNQLLEKETKVEFLGLVQNYHQYAEIIEEWESAQNAQTKSFVSDEENETYECTSTSATIPSKDDIEARKNSYIR